MAYFREFPNINYVSLLPDRNKNEERILVKNIFKEHWTRAVFYGIPNYMKFKHKNLLG